MAIHFVAAKAVHMTNKSNKIHMKPLYILFFFLNLSSFFFSQQNKICFTIDDLPVVNYGISDTLFQKTILSKLITSFNKNNIPAIGFVNENKLYTNDTLNSFQTQLLHEWVMNGYELGNHTFSHIDYNVSNLKEYTTDLERGELITKEILTQNHQCLKYFRHPFLHVGNSKEKADSLSEYLSRTGYTIAPVTFDSDDYIFASAYQKAFVKNDTLVLKQIGKDYITHLQNKIHFYEKQSNTLFGRNIHHILLLHANLLNADYMDTIAKLFIDKQYDFINLDKALKDELYKTEITVYGRWGISWIDKWALSRGYTKDFFKDEPAIPSYIESYK